MSIAKKIFIGIGGVVFVLLLVVGGFIFKFKSETNKMTATETGKIIDNIYAVKDSFVNMYLIKDGDKYIAIDAGMDKKVISEELRKLNIDPVNVVAVLLTHTDMDHVAALDLFVNAKIYVSEPEVKMLTGEKQKIPLISNEISRKDYILLEDKQILNIGKVKALGIMTEGHTSGSMCFLLNDKYLFTGDILSLHNGKIGTSVKFFDLDHEMTDKSIVKITQLKGAAYIFTSHFGYTSDYKTAVSDWK